MSRIRATDTKPELIIRRFLFENGYRFRLHVKELPGKPDIVLKKYNTIILVHGCFWHGHMNCKYFKIPSTRKEWWLTKIDHTKKLDYENKVKLCNLGWKVIEIWECELKSNKENTLNLLLRAIKIKVNG